MSATRLSWLISLGGSGLAALAFLLVTLLAGDYDWVARLGGGLHGSSCSPLSSCSPP
jgi:hypothetical protein